MSTYLGDFKNSILLQPALAPATVGDNTPGSTLDMIDADGRCVAVQIVGNATGSGPTLNGKIQESSDGTTWTDVANGAFTQVTASNNLQTIVFDRTKRYLRFARALGGSGPNFALAALIGQQRKNI
jgi:hypothetical protein